MVLVLALFIIAIIIIIFIILFSEIFVFFVLIEPIITLILIICAGASTSGLVGTATIGTTQGSFFSIQLFGAGTHKVQRSAAHLF